MDTLSEERIELMAELGASFAVLCMTPTPVLCQQLRDVINRLEAYLLCQEETPVVRQTMVACDVAGCQEEALVHCSVTSENGCCPGEFCQYHYTQIHRPEDERDDTPFMMTY